jgi:hypothetical protein
MNNELPKKVEEIEIALILVAGLVTNSDLSDKNVSTAISVTDHIIKYYKENKL